jgi:hypothetical protein
MTSRRSSTSSSDRRRYLTTLLATLAALVVALVGVTATGYRLGLVEAANHDIYRYQRAKIDGTAPIDIAFVGDSSLGNAIDAALFADLAGRPTANLALNGSYGSGGSYNMVRKLLAAKRPRLIVVMQSIDTMRRDEAFPGFYFSAEPSEVLTSSPIRILELYFSWKTAKRVVEQIRKGGLAARGEIYDGDYISQAAHPIGRAPAAEVEVNPLLPTMVADAQLRYLAQIAGLCRGAGVECVYAHGPIYVGYCAQSQPYLNALDAAIDATGLERIADTPLCIAESDVGNSIDHVRSDLKQDYTRRYYALLRDTIGSLGK